MAEHSDSESFREFAREITLKIDRTLQGFAAGLEVMRDDIRASREDSRRYFEALHAELGDLRAESRAQTQALLRVIDRLDGGASA